MAVFDIRQIGDFRLTFDSLKRMISNEAFTKLDYLAQTGAFALSSATPKLTGETASEWGYEIEASGDAVQIAWTNTEMIEGVPLVILLQYGHGTRQGGYVEGQDFINPAIRPIFDKIADEVWDTMTRG